MSYSDEERIERNLWSIPFRATAAEARSIYAEIVKTSEWRHWSILSDRLQYGDFIATESAGLALCTEHSDAYRAMSLLVLRAVTKLEDA